jgi:hypothetical protein
MSSREADRASAPPIAWRAVGCAAALTVLLGAGECFLRWYPPSDFYAYLGDASPVIGPYVADAEFGVTYRDWEAFRAENRERLDPFIGDGNGRGDPIWAFFGNSFVQAPGMLADRARERVRDRRVFNLGRNEHLFVRLAQIQLLLDHGLRPERLFVALMPIEMLGLGPQPLSTIYVTSRGALTYRPRLPPPPFDWLVSRSSLVQAAWFRAGGQRGNPSFDRHAIHGDLVEPLRSDLARLFAHLAQHARAHAIPVTILLIPSHHQVVRGAPYGFQDSVTALLQPLGFDIFDPRSIFASHPDPAALYAPDFHLSPDGNDLLLDALLRHLGRPAQLDASARATMP